MTKKARTKRQMVQAMERLNKMNGENMEQKQEALAFLNTAVEIGNKVFCCIPIKMLKIDHAMYQRPLQKKFKFILDNWDDDQCDPIVVNYRNDGYYYVINGQHRTEAAKVKGITQLVCDVFVGLPLKKEAEMFAGQYDGCTKPSPIDSYRANIIRGELVDTLIKKVCDKYCVVVSHDRVPKVLGSLTVARRIIKPSKNASDEVKAATENAKILDWMFDIFKKSEWESYKETYNADILQCLWYVYKNNINTLNESKEKLINFFKTVSPKKIKAIGNIKYPECGHGGGIYRIMIDVINGMEVETLESVA